MLIHINFPSSASPHKTSVQPALTFFSETLRDLLDLYTQHRPLTLLGPHHPIDRFISTSITLNEEAKAANLPRYTNWIDAPATTTTSSATANGIKRLSNGLPKSPSTPSATTPQTAAPTPKPSSWMSVPTPNPNGNGNGNPNPNTVPQHHQQHLPIGVRGQNGTVRFMLDPKRAKEERKVVEGFFKVEEEEYEVEVEVEKESPREREREREKGSTGAERGQRGR